MVNWRDTIRGSCRFVSVFRCTVDVSATYHYDTYHYDPCRNLGQLPFEDVEVFERDGGDVDFGDEVWQGECRSDVTVFLNSL